MSARVKNDDTELEQLREDNRVLSDQVRAFAEREPDNAYEDSIQKVVSYPQVQVLRTLFFIALRYYFAARGVSFTNASGWWDEFLVWSTSIVIVLLTLYYTFGWVEAESSRAGVGGAYVKLGMFLIGVYLSIAAFNGRLFMADWSTSPECNQTAANIGFGITGLISISNLGNWFAHLFTNSQQQPFRALRDWFA